MTFSVGVGKANITELRVCFCLINSIKTNFITLKVYQGLSLTQKCIFLSLFLRKTQVVFFDYRIKTSTTRI